MTTRHWRARSLPEGELLGGGSGRGVEAGEELKPSAPKLMLVIRLGRRLSTEAVWKPRRRCQAPKWSVLNSPGLGGSCPNSIKTRATPLRNFSPACKRRRLALSTPVRIRCPVGHQHAPNLRLLGVESRPSSCIPRGCGRAGRPSSRERESVWSTVARPSG
jgi:hypothetical protein